MQQYMHSIAVDLGMSSVQLSSVCGAYQIQQGVDIRENIAEAQHQGRAQGKRPGLVRPHHQEMRL